MCQAKELAEKKVQKLQEMGESLNAKLVSFGCGIMPV